MFTLSLRKNHSFLLFAGSLIGFIVGLIFVFHYDLGLCYRDLSQNIFDIGCSNTYERVGEALTYGAGTLTLVFLVLFFVPRAFSAWKKFAVWFVPLAALLFIFYPNPGSGDLFSPYPEEVFQWVSALYLLISLAIIARASRKVS